MRICNQCALGSNKNEPVNFPRSFEQKNDYCNFCGKDSDNTVDCSDLEPIYQAVLDSYEPNKNAESTLIESLVDDWHMLNCHDKLVDLLQACLPSIKTDPARLYKKASLKSSEYDDVDNSSHYWHHLVTSIQKSNRYFPKYRKEIEALFESMADSGYINYVQTVYEGLLYRARAGNYTDKEEMKMPPVDKTTPGRANSDGIPVLYTATNIDTAIRELRPIQDTIVSVVEIEVEETLNLYSFTDLLGKVNPITLIADNRFTQFDNDTDLCIWFSHWTRFQRAISKSLSEPVRKRFEDISNYAPTQFLCDWIKSEGADGVLFDSAVGKGQNVVLFNEDKIKFEDVKHYEIVDVEYTHKQLTSLR